MNKVNLIIWSYSNGVQAINLALRGSSKYVKIFN